MRSTWIVAALAGFGGSVGFHLMPLFPDDSTSRDSARPVALASVAGLGSVGSASAPSPARDPLPEVPPPVALAAPPPLTHGYLRALVEPSTEVTLDGRPLRGSIREPLQLSPGRHRLTLRNAEVAGRIDSVVTIEAGQTLERKYSFADYGHLLVVVKPWAEVLIDDDLVGQTPIDRIKAAPGERVVTLRHPQAGQRTERVTIRPGQTTLLRVSLLPSTSD